MTKTKSKVKSKETKEIQKAKSMKPVAKKPGHEASGKHHADGKKKPELKKASAALPAKKTVTSGKPAVHKKVPTKSTKEADLKTHKKPVDAKVDLKKHKKPETKKLEVKKASHDEVGSEKLKAKHKDDVEPRAKKAKEDLQDVSKAKSVEAKKQAKPEVAGKARKEKVAKTEAPEEDLLVEDTEDFGSDELSEYESELASAEDESEDEVVWTEEQSALTVPVVSPKESSGGLEEIVLTDAEGRRYCRVRDCDQIASVDSYCRYHYLLLWKKIQVRKRILADGKLERYVEELTSRYPDKFLEVIRRDLRTEKDFVAAIQELEIDESSVDNDYEDESSNFIDEVRGASTEGISDDEEF